VTVTNTAHSIFAAALAEIPEAHAGLIYICVGHMLLELVLR